MNETINNLIDKIFTIKVEYNKLLLKVNENSSEFYFFWGLFAALPIAILILCNIDFKSHVSENSTIAEIITFFLLIILFLSVLYTVSIVAITVLLKLLAKLYFSFYCKYPIQPTRQDWKRINDFLLRISFNDTVEYSEFNCKMTNGETKVLTIYTLSYRSPKLRLEHPFMFTLNRQMHIVDAKNTKEYSLLDIESLQPITHNWYIIKNFLSITK